MADNNSINDRQQKAFELIANKGFISLIELAVLLGISESTARRDLEAIERTGGIVKTHGGAICTKYRYGYHFAASDRQKTMVVEKRAIARAVAELTGRDKSVIINGGTTCCYIAELLASRHLSVVTNCPQIATLLSPDMDTEVTLLGGYIYPRTGVALGDTAEQQLSGVCTSLGILSCASIGSDGVYNANRIMVDMDRRIIQSADKVILAVDHSKFGAFGLVKQCGFNEIDILVTDSGIEQDWLEKLKATDVEIVIADVSA